MKTLCTIIACFIFLISFSQKQDIKIKDDIVYVNSQEVFKATTQMAGNTITIYNLNGERLIVFNYQTFNDNTKISQSNPSGAVRYIDVTFLNEDMDKCEIQSTIKKGLVKQIIENQLIDNEGKLNDQMVKQFARINGNKITGNKNHSTTIIINH
ncbi:MAG: hypothetical protein M9916_05165 [Crocinitomicaceae bacterium]|nr:hypothetical protein [Crocinitomicaceae bacterium]